MTARSYAPGIGEAVANRTINRKITKHVVPYKATMDIPRRDDISLDDEVAAYCKNAGFEFAGYEVLHGNDERVQIEVEVTGEIRTEEWSDVAHRVALGNALLEPRGLSAQTAEFDNLHHHLAQASLLMSGRHLQHGDESQPTRNMEVFTNCSTSATTFLMFYLLLNGSGVGRAYDDQMIVADMNKLPIVVPVIDMTHKDVQSGEIACLDARTARHIYGAATVHEFKVPDSREGWAKALELMEFMAFEGTRRQDVLLLDFSDVRPRGAPIAGMQGRPASGPGPLMSAIRNIASLRDAGMAPWRATMYADHYVAECVLVGGARRAARMATKFWKDPTIFGFIEVKRGGFLWSSNNSVTVDQEFWDGVKSVQEIAETIATKDDALRVKLLEKMVGEGVVTATELHAWKVYRKVCECSYFDGTGEPGLINVDRLTWNEEGVEALLDGDFAKSSRYSLNEDTLSLTRELVKAWLASTHKVITNPCGEIVLGSLGGYCVIADVVPFHAGMNMSTKDYDTKFAYWQAVDADAEDAFRAAVRALIRTNTMNCLYGKEVARTNRIGVGMTGLHEYAWSRFGYGFRDIIDEQKSMDFWLTLSRFKRAVQNEAASYAAKLGVNVPHTDTTMKPAGCASLDTAIKTTEGTLTMRELFAKHGVTEDDLRGMEDGTWIEPKIKTLVLDEGNAEREVTKLYLNGVKPVYEIEFEDGTVVKLTGNHKLKTVAGEWKRVDELTDADEILQF